MLTIWRNASELTVKHIIPLGKVSLIVVHSPCLHASQCNSWHPELLQVTPKEKILFIPFESIRDRPLLKSVSLDATNTFWQLDENCTYFFKSRFSCEWRLGYSKGKSRDVGQLEFQNITTKAGLKSGSVLKWSNHYTTETIVHVVAFKQTQFMPPWFHINK